MRTIEIQNLCSKNVYGGAKSKFQNICDKLRNRMIRRGGFQSRTQSRVVGRWSHTEDVFCKLPSEASIVSDVSSVADETCDSSHSSSGSSASSITATELQVVGATFVFTDYSSNHILVNAQRVKRVFASIARVG
jgi:hypothetical protein